MMHPNTDKMVGRILSLSKQLWQYKSIAHDLSNYQVTKMKNSSTLPDYKVSIRVQS